MSAISVVIPTYNRGADTRRAVLSAARQSLAPAEIIVVDDGSTDGSDAELSRVLTRLQGEYPHIDIKLLRAGKHLGANAARNIGISYASSEWVAFLDSDDLWRGDKLEKQIKKICSRELDGKDVFCYTGRIRFDINGNIIVQQSAQAKVDGRSILTANMIGTLSSVLVKRSTILNAGGFDEALSAAQDWDFYIRLLTFCMPVLCDEPLVYYADGGKQRISRSSRNRIRSHLKLHRTYMRGIMTKYELSAFYCLLAEDLQLIGKHRLARRLVLRSVMYAHDGLGPRVLRIISFWYGIRNFRYLKYRFATLKRSLDSGPSRESLVRDLISELDI